MRNSATPGRIFYGIAIMVIGLVTVCTQEFPYMLIPPNHAGMPGLRFFVNLAGFFLTLAGISVVIKKSIRLFSLLLGTVLLLIFCFYFVPYEFLSGQAYWQFGEWENAEKELALAGGALVIAGRFPEINEGPLMRLLAKFIPAGAILFALTMICFGIDHFLFLQDVVDYIPFWIPFKLFWATAGGIGLIGGGLSIILKIKTGLFVFLSGTMIFLWFVLLHVPRIIASPLDALGSEITSACLALGYSGVAYVIAGKRKMG